MTQDHRPKRLAFIGFGEAARAFLTGWGEGRPPSVSAYDRKTDNTETRGAMNAAYGDHGVRGGFTSAEAVDGADAVFSTVTADQALVAATEAAPTLPAGAVWFDCNSCAPGTKRAAAKVIENAGGHYVDVAVMAPVHPKLHKVPLLIAGPAAERAVAVLGALNMEPVVSGADVGQASSIKMIRSVMVKGMEALMAECFLSAKRAGVEEEVIASLEASHPDIQWRSRGAYNLERMVVHGTRRAAELREVARTVDELGLLPVMSAATAQWEDKLAGLVDATDAPGLAPMLTRILDKL